MTADLTSSSAVSSVPPTFCRTRLSLSSSLTSSSNLRIVVLVLLLFLSAPAPALSMMNTNPATAGNTPGNNQLGGVPGGVPMAQSSAGGTSGDVAAMMGGSPHNNGANTGGVLNTGGMGPMAYPNAVTPVYPAPYHARELGMGRCE